MLRAVEGLAVDRPVALVLEDLHWADTGSVELLDYLARNMDEDAVLSPLTCHRSDEIERRPSVHRVLTELRLQPAVTRFDLAGLSRDEIATLLAGGHGRDTVVGGRGRRSRTLRRQPVVRRGTRPRPRRRRAPARARRFLAVRIAQLPPYCAPWWTRPRSGTNNLLGTVFAYYRSDRLRAKGALETGDLPFDRGQYGFTLGGPIVKDKTHFFLSAEYVKTHDLPLSFRPGGAFASQAKDIPHPWDQTMTFASIDHSVSDSQRVTAKFTYERYREDNFHVGGVSDESWGNQLNRDNWNLTLQHTLAPSPNYLNELYLQVGGRKYDEPTNSSAVEEWFSSGNTLKTGTNTTGDIVGDGTQWEIRDTAHLYGDTHEWKMGFSLQHVNEESDIPTFTNGTFVYYNDTRALPISYLYGVGSADVKISDQPHRRVPPGRLADGAQLHARVRPALGPRHERQRPGLPVPTRPQRPQARLRQLPAASRLLLGRFG